jgi:hypothetical protein
MKLTILRKRKYFGLGILFSLTRGYITLEVANIIIHLELPYREKLKMSIPGVGFNLRDFCVGFNFCKIQDSYRFIVYMWPFGTILWWTWKNEEFKLWSLR